MHPTMMILFMDAQRSQMERRTRKRIRRRRS